MLDRSDEIVDLAIETLEDTGVPVLATNRGEKDHKSAI